MKVEQLRLSDMLLGLIVALPILLGVVMLVIVGAIPFLKRKFKK
jgi:hypothetical protein